MLFETFFHTAKATVLNALRQQLWALEWLNEQPAEKST